MVNGIVRFNMLIRIDVYIIGCDNFGGFIVLFVLEDLKVSCGNEVFEKVLVKKLDMFVFLYFYLGG